MRKPLPNLATQYHVATARPMGVLLEVPPTAVSRQHCKTALTSILLVEYYGLSGIQNGWDG